MRHGLLARMRANCVLFALSLVIVDLLTLLILAVSRHLERFNDDIIRMMVLAISFALAIATKIQARSAFEVASSKGYVTKEPVGREDARLMVGDDCPAAWLVQLHIESCADADQHCAPQRKSRLPS
jgi:hypothetical protein